LEVDASADRRALKARYYEVVNLYHPDRYFGRSLGNFKPKLERIFQRVTEAYDVLSRPTARAEYDAYLTRHVGAEALHKLLNDEQARTRQLREVEDRILAEARLGERNESLRPPSGSVPAPGVAKTSDPVPPLPENDWSRASDPGRISTAELNETRRRVLARKLGGSLPPPAARVQPTPPVSSPETRERAVQDLKRRYEERLLEARRRKASEYVAQADLDLGRNDLANAVNSLRIAASLLPSDDALAKRARELETRAMMDLSDRYLKQAEYEQREGRFADAVRSYTRALAGKPSAQLHDRTAHCLLSANGDMKKAVEHARIAVAEDPTNPAYRVTLARVFLAASMNDSAMGELERAKTLAPTDDTIKSLIRRLQRGA
jgi:tetratricopeptide (TPR) repeat protein